MFCPQCKLEYRAGFTKCNDCDLDLVEDLDDVVENHDDPGYVRVATVQGLMEEQQLRSFLEANDIPTEVSGEAVRITHALTIDGLGAASVLVPRKFAAKARDLLEKAEQGDLEIDE